VCRPPDNREFMKPIQSPVITENRHSSQVPHSRRSAQTAFHLPESVELLEKRGALRRRSGMIVKTVEIEKNRTDITTPTQPCEPRAKNRTGITTATQPCESRARSRGRRRRGVGSTISGSRAHSERTMDGGRNRIATRHDRWGGLIGCSKWLQCMSSALPPWTSMNR
jgi:hypothetical protein